MKKALLFSLIVTCAQCIYSQAYKMSFIPFQGSTGAQHPLQQISMPQNEIVYLNNAMNDRSGLGPTFNFHGNVVVLDYIDRLPNGNVQIQIRREDGKDFFGQLPTLQAVLHPVDLPEASPSIVLN